MVNYVQFDGMFGVHLPFDGCYTHHLPNGGLFNSNLPLGTIRKTNSLPLKNGDGWKTFSFPFGVV